MKGFSGFTMIVATICSTIIHFFILTLLDTLPLVPKEIPPRTDIFMVDLIQQRVARAVPQEKREVAVQKKVEEVTKQELKEEEAAKQEMKKEAPKKEEKKEQVVLADQNNNKETKKKPEVDDEQQRLAAIKKIEQKVAGRRPDDAPIVTDSEIQIYVAMTRERVKRFWAIPDTLLSEKDLKAVIIIEIDQQGHVRGSRFEQSSGNDAFDQAARRAISKAAPFTPPPGKMSLEIGLIFQPR